MFAYPNGSGQDFNGEIVNLLKNAGYERMHFVPRNK